MNSGRGGSRFSGFSVGPRPRANLNKADGSLHAVPPPPSMTRLGNPNTIPLATRFSRPGVPSSSSAGYNRFHPQPGAGRIDVELVPPVSISKQGYSTLNAISQGAINTTYGVPTNRPKTEDDYFDEDDDEPPSNEPLYQPGPDSPTFTKNAESDDEEDPLDAFMNDLNQKVKKEAIKVPEKEDLSGKNKAKGVRHDIEEEDDEESYYRYIKENPLAGLQGDDSDSEQIEYDEDGNPIKLGKKHIDPLPPIDHSTITYAPFEKNFYEEHDEIKNLPLNQSNELRETLGLKVSGISIPKPVCSFAHFNFDEKLLNVIRKSEFTNPTPIQSQAIPAALSGRDVIGIAQTGSGKTAAFLWPMIVHILDQPVLKQGDGPIGVILAPTRELSQQIYTEAKKFCKVFGISVVCCYGGGSKWEQSKDLEQGAEIVVATPGRMIDLVKIKATNLQRVTFLVLDEADRMFDMGFEPQVRSICNHVRPERQTLLFSATFKKRIEKLARDVLSDPIRIVQGDVGEANQDVTQVIEVIAPTAKYSWLIVRLVEFMASGSVLIFVTKKANAEELCASLKSREMSVALLHGDMDQIDRNQVISSFKKKEMDILVATDVAARGLDIPHIRTVINYDIARDIDTHTHRIGRTGRAGEKGTAFTLVTPADKEFAGHLVRNLEGANQQVPEPLMDLAMQSAWFRKSRFKGGQGRKPNVGGRGLGYSDKTPTTANRTLTGANAIKPVFQSGPSSFSKPTQGPAAAAGPSGGRLAAMKAAFQSQYKQQFCSSSDNKPPQPLASDSNSAEGSGQRPVKKKSRWDD
ncbi:ATP-dependent RNA helicase DDX42-like [Daphnia carinata]|uniref:ATP-dependent RNA helicase DDX42-like n=1 Tax=Daphnia carinata TaxID=120202 RepID=UPI00257A9EAF|nr:ATP-dependent RNA helicase DDX42-like [Daphnia carinata]